MKTTTLTKKENTSTLAPNNINDMFGVGGIQLPVDAPLPQIKILRETPMFELPDGTPVKELVGHILYWHNANQYYSKAFGEGEQLPPDCFSSNGIAPDGGTAMQSCDCKDCPYNQYGSAGDGKGKACSNTIRMYVLLDGDVIPVLIKASPSSLGKKESLMRWLTNAPNVAAKAGCGVAYQPIKVKFALHKKDFASGFSASVLDLSTVCVLDPKTQMDEIKKLATITRQFKEVYLGKVAQYMANEMADDTPSSNTGADDNIPI